jgi:acyl-coenzyme A synthetase/AMP-(fatty) acid ligase
VVSELPKTLSGKVQKFRLREIIRDTLARETTLETR